MVVQCPNADIEVSSDPAVSHGGSSGVMMYALLRWVIQNPNQSSKISGPNRTSSDGDTDSHYADILPLPRNAKWLINDIL